MLGVLIMLYDSIATLAQGLPPDILFIEYACGDTPPPPDIGNQGQRFEIIKF